MPWKTGPRRKQCRPCREQVREGNRRLAGSTRDRRRSVPVASPRRSEQGPARIVRCLVQCNQRDKQAGQTRRDIRFSAGLDDRLRDRLSDLLGKIKPSMVTREVKQENASVNQRA